MSIPGPFRHSTQLTVLTVLLIVGCNTGNGSGKNLKTGGAAPTSSSNPTPSGVTVTVTKVANPTTATLGGVANPLMFTAAAPAGSTPLLTTVRVTASGTAKDDSTFTRLILTRDTNTNGVIDAQDIAIAQAVPAFAADNGTTTLTVAGGNGVPGGGTAQYIVSLELVGSPSPTTINEIAAVGSTVTLTLAATTDITFTNAGAAATSGGTFPVAGNPVALSLNDHILISEICVGPNSPTNAEYIELFNPTGAAIDMTNYHLTDFSNNVIGQDYFRLPTNNNFGGGNPSAGTGPASDFSVRFPANFMIQPGEYVVIALDGAGYAAVFPSPANPVPRLAMRAPQAGSSLMGVWNGVTTANAAPVFTPATAVHAGAGLTDGGEQIWLFFWNGALNPAPDLVSDVDMLGWGSATATNFFSAKTGVSQDGPDTNTTPTTYLADTAANVQEGNRVLPAGFTAASSKCIRRTNYSEGAEVKTGGNGLTGHNETSEAYTATFTAPTTPSPGRFQ